MAAIELLSVGSVVRVLFDVGNGAPWSTRATVALVNQEEGTLDVVYLDPEWAYGVEEEGNVSLARVLPLLPFESGLLSGEDFSENPFILKDQGNDLWRTGDYGAALERYNFAMQLIAPRLSAGSTVIVLPASDSVVRMAPQRATVYDVEEGGKAGVFFDEEANGEGEDDEEEDGVDPSRLVPVSSNVTEQAKLYLNACRCLMKSPAGKVQDGIQRASIAIALLGSANDGAEGPGVDEYKGGGQDLILSAYEVRARALCRAGEFAAAKKDVTRLGRMPGHKARALKLLDEVCKEEEKRLQSNKRLVKSMSKWIQTSMQSYGEESAGGAGGGAAAGGGGIAAEDDPAMEPGEDSRRCGCS